MKAKCMKNMKNAEREEEIKYLEEMKTLKKELNLDDLYYKKFGLLKKASLLNLNGRKKDAKFTIATAAEIVQTQRRKDDEKQEAIQQRWKFKLGLDDGFELPEKVNIKKKPPHEITDEDLAEVDFGNGVTIATVRLYIEKVSPFNHEAYSKNVFLDRCIEELYMEIESKKMKSHADIEKMKKYIEGLEEYAELVE